MLEMYQNFIEIELENQRKEEIKLNAENVLRKMDNNR